MSHDFFPQLPDRWETHVAPHAATGCWIWTDARLRPLTWRQARTLIATLLNLPESTECALTPTCVKPSHTEATRTPAGGSS